MITVGLVLLVVITLVIVIRSFLEGKASISNAVLLIVVLLDLLLIPAGVYISTEESKYQAYLDCGKQPVTKEELQNYTVKEYNNLTQVYKSGNVAYFNLLEDKCQTLK